MELLGLSKAGATAGRTGMRGRQDNRSGPGGAAAVTRSRTVSPSLGLRARATGIAEDL